MMRAPKLRLTAVGASVIAVSLVIALVAVHLYQATLAGPAVPTTAEIPGLDSYQFVSAQTGYIQVDARGYPIVKTTDGGMTWHRVFSADDLGPGSTMQWIEANRGYVFGHRGDPMAIIWQTSDGGAHWRLHTIPAPTDATPILLTGYFVDPMNGWIVFGREILGPPDLMNGVVSATTDGGDHWTRLADAPPDLGAYVPRIRFFTTKVGVLTNGTGASIWSSPLVTYDGGMTFRASGVGGLGCGEALCPIAAVGPPVFFSNTTGVKAVTWEIVHPPAFVGCLPHSPCPPGAVEYLERDVYQTTDGITRRMVARLDRATGELIFLDARRWIDIAAAGVSVTKDAGSSWSARLVIPVPADWTIGSIQYYDLDRGFVELRNQVGPTSVLYRMLATSDRGHTWRQVNLPKV